MNDLFRIDVGAEQGAVIPVNKGKPIQKMSQDISMAGASILFEGYFRDITKTFVDDYGSVFSTAMKEYGQNTNTIGQLTVQYNRAALSQEFVRKIRKSTQNYDITFQKPSNDLELYEWSQGFDSDIRMKGISTKDDDFATGFCLVHDAWETGVPFNDSTRYEWASRLADKASSADIKDMYIFIPSSNRGEEFARDGINFHFIPTSNHKLSMLSQKVQDNQGVEKRQYVDNRLTMPNSFHLRDIQLGASTSEHFLVDTQGIFSGEGRFNESTIAEGLVGEALDFIIGEAQAINKDAAIAKSPFTFIFK